MRLKFHYNTQSIIWSRLEIYTSVLILNTYLKCTKLHKNLTYSFTCTDESPENMFFIYVNLMDIYFFICYNGAQVSGIVVQQSRDTHLTEDDV